MKPLFTLRTTFRGNTLPLHFTDIEGMLAGRAAILASGFVGLTVDEDPANPVLIETPAKAAAHVRLWIESLGGSAPAPRPAAKPVEVAARTEEPSLPSGLTHKEECLHMLLRPEGVTLDQLMERFGILRDSASALISTTRMKFGYEVNRSDDGVYHAVPKAEPEKKGKAATKVATHVLGRGRRAIESRRAN